MFSIRKWDFPKLNLTYFWVSVELKENFNLNRDVVRCIMRRFSVTHSSVPLKENAVFCTLDTCFFQNH